jgi:transcriptional regulator with XRE-family HTH domain
MEHSRELPTCGEEWEALRNRAGLTRAELARRTALDPSTLWTLEHDGYVSQKVRLLVAAALGLKVFPSLELVA